jgi:hypothetical protein
VSVFSHGVHWRPACLIACTPPHLLPYACDCRPALAARYGGPRQSMALAIGRLLALGDPELVGVFAQLGYVDEPRLGAVLGANFAAAMQV